MTQPTNSNNPADKTEEGAGCSCSCGGSNGSAEQGESDSKKTNPIADNPAAAKPAGAESLSIREHKPEEYRLQGHMLLAKMGKRVLRPGGLELTQRIIKRAAPTSGDRIVEFGPGVGRTAEILLEANPEHYIGIEPQSPGIGQLRTILDRHPEAELIEANAQDTGLPDACATLVVGEAMLTMQSPVVKRAIIDEAFRILEPGGRYAIHELGFTDTAADDAQKDVAKTLSRTIKVGARPLTVDAWSELFEEAGFTVEYSTTNPMHLLEPKRLISDEGLVGALRFAFNVARNKAARERIKKMRSTFRKNEDSLNAVALVLRKPAAK